EITTVESGYIQVCAERAFRIRREGGEEGLPFVLPVHVAIDTAIGRSGAAERRNGGDLGAGDVFIAALEETDPEIAVAENGIANYGIPGGAPPHDPDADTVVP